MEKRGLKKGELWRVLRDRKQGLRRTIARLYDDVKWSRNKTTSSQAVALGIMEFYTCDKRKQKKFSQQKFY
jgi:hypothetical protein